MNMEDSLPWYRQFWPWFVIMIPAATVVAGFYTLYLAVDTTDSLVTSAEGGMDVVAERHRVAEQRAYSMGLDATVDINRTTGAMLAELLGTPDGDWPPSLELLFSHPTNAQLDRTVTLSRAIPGDGGVPRWAGHDVNVPSGRWYLILKSSDDWRLYGVWSGEPAARLRPASATDNDGGG
jgi:hypothetical protein